MARAPFQVLVLPYRKAEAGYIEYALFSRSNMLCWQFISGGGEDDELPLAAAKREASEEGSISSDYVYMPLDTRTSIPVNCFAESYRWSEDLFVIPEYSFAVEVGLFDFKLSEEHNEYRWMRYEEAVAKLTFDGNRTALWELNQKLLGKGPRD